MNRNSQPQPTQRQQSNMTNHNRNSGSFGGTDISASGSPAYFTNGRDRTGGQQQTFDLARSPPNVSNKSMRAQKLEATHSDSKIDTKHVPCKFFRQGACQAGAACPFSHSLDPMMHQAPCKYFMKVRNPL